VLNLVQEALAQMGLPLGRVEPHYYINITIGDSLSISVFLESQRFVQVKASEFVDLQELHDTNCRAWRDHSPVMARPLGHVRIGIWSIVASEGVRHGIVRPVDLFGHWLAAGSLSDPLQGFFEVGAKSSAHESMALRSQLEKIVAWFSGTSLAEAAQRCVEKALSGHLVDLPRIPQHGDFVVNNLGRAASGLVVFDWEDYGKIEVPGLDIFTLCLSATDFDVDALRRIGSPISRRDRALSFLVTRACAGQRISVDAFEQLLPFYALVFVHLKRNYGQAVQQRAVDVFSRLAGEQLPATLDALSRDGSRTRGR
jgi:hypothetical protein